MSAPVDGLDITEYDFLTLDEDGKITEFRVMTRPPKASQALADRMAEGFAGPTTATPVPFECAHDMRSS